MSDYLTRIAAKSMNREEVIQPRLASIFEPPKPSSWRTYELLGLEDQASGQRPLHELESPRIYPNPMSSEEPSRSSNSMPSGEPSSSLDPVSSENRSSSFDPMSSEERSSSFDPIPSGELSRSPNPMSSGDSSSSLDLISSGDPSRSSKPTISSVELKPHKDMTGRPSTILSNQPHSIPSVSDEIAARFEPSNKGIEGVDKTDIEKKPARYYQKIKHIPVHEDDKIMDNSRPNAPSSKINGKGIKERSSRIGEEMAGAGKEALPIAKDSSEARIPLAKEEKRIEPLKPAPHEMLGMARAAPSGNSDQESIQMARNIISNISNEPIQKEPVAVQGRAVTKIESMSNLASAPSAMRPPYIGSHEPERVIQVTIGRVEVKAVSPPPQTRRQSSGPVVTSLEEYLNQRARKCGR